MIHRLHYTSAPHGIQGRTLGGFCTVRASTGMPASLERLLESLSAYKHLYPPHHRLAGQNPVEHRHVLVNWQSQTMHLLSRIRSVGVDHTGRSNFFAAHALLPHELTACTGPLALLNDRHFLATEWNSTFDPLPTMDLLPMTARPQPVRFCSYWQDYAGDPGWAGIAAASVRANKNCYIAFQTGQDLMPLVGELLGLFPDREQWRVTFSTYFVDVPPNVQCRLRFILAGSPQHALACSRGACVIDLTAHQKCPAGPMCQAARNGVRLEALATVSTAALPACDNRFGTPGFDSSEFPSPPHPAFDSNLDLQIPQSHVSPSDLTVPIDSSRRPTLPGTSIPTIQLCSVDRRHTRASKKTNAQSAFVAACVGGFATLLVTGLVLTPLTLHFRNLWSDAEQRLAALHAVYDTTREQSRQQSTELTRVSSLLRDTERNQEQSKQENSRLTTELDAAHTELASTAYQLREHSTDVTRLESQLEDQRSELERRRVEIEHFHEQLQQLQDKLQAQHQESSSPHHLSQVARRILDSPVDQRTLINKLSALPQWLILAGGPLDTYVMRDGPNRMKHLVISHDIVVAVIELEREKDDVNAYWVWTENVADGSEQVKRKGCLVNTELLAIFDEASKAILFTTAAESSHE